ncbi:peptidylprolyl isomerase [Candidatus Pelagibacter sp. Uisw_121]|uniref:peptidylprolyl isomerase n=2 Tax=unclassified Candidatus Pelagibacter TaxID=2647897 RepID=UPI0039E74D7C|tara:strand:+ start:350 stop:1282 length:933 start_codon:yes stop_codon:yes gene_type:complete
MFKKIFILFTIINLLSNVVIAENKHEIIIKINNQIITNFDIQKETKYLLALNPSLNNLSTKQIKELSKNSLIREKIKENEILKYYKINYEDPELTKFVTNIYKRLNIGDEAEFNTYLSKFDMNINTVIKKIAIERDWNKMIFGKFKNQIVVNELKIKKNLEKKLDKSEIQTSYLISEILFQAKNEKEFEETYNDIIKAVDESSFKSAASIYSISDSSINSGEIGWVKKNEISNSIYNELNKLNIGDITQPIKVASGFLIIYLEDVKKVEKEINTEEEFKKIVTTEKNRQLNEYSIIYYKKIKKQIFINEK